MALPRLHLEISEKARQLYAEAAARAGLTLTQWVRTALNAAVGGEDLHVAPKVPPIPPIVVRAIRLLQASGMSQREIARELDVTEGAVSRIVAGTRRKSA
jgi:Homeodomain-like domain